VQPYSVSKPVAAACALMLVDAERLELDAPVQRYWPEFRAPATVRQVLCHQAGVVAIDEPVDTAAFYDWDRLCALLARQEPAFEPGSAQGESALFYGHLVGELVRRLDRRSIGQFLREQICGPLELDFQFGLSPRDQDRAIDLTGLSNEFWERNVSTRPELYERAMTNPPGALDAAVVNSADWRAAEIPAVNGHGTAGSLVGFYDALLAGRILSRDLVAEATRPQSSGPDLVMGADVSWGLGFRVEAAGFGMGGLGGNYAGVSLDGGYALAFVTGSMGTHDRVEALEEALRRCLGLS
jgi:CubicO group peptidase (beta-lactamase class C family)